MYTADLGYINVYDKTIYSIARITAVKQLSDAIQVGQFFDFDVLQRLSKNSNNVIHKFSHETDSSLKWSLEFEGKSSYVKTLYR
jgi:hypothetical protein